MFLKNKYTIYLLVIIGAIYLISMPNRITSMDEAILAEQAYWFAEDGVVKSRLFAGMGQGWEYIQLHYHKLFIWIGALGIKIFGFSWYLFKIIPFAFFLGFMIIFRKYLNSEGLGDFIFLAFSLLIFNYFIFYLYFHFRPEVLIMFFGFLSYYFLQKGLKDKIVYVFIAGFIGAVCALLHLNGLIFLAAGGILLLFKKEFKLTVVFSIAGFIGLFFYFIEVLTPEMWQLYIDQLFNDPNVKEDSLGAAAPLFKLLNEHQRLFRGPREITMTALALVPLLLNWKFLKNNHSGLLIYTLVLVVSMAVIAHGITSKYSLIYFPFFILIFLYSFNNVDKIKRNVKIGYALVGVYLVAHAIFIVPTFSAKSNIPKRSAYFASLMETENAKVFSTDTFIFNQLPGHDITGFLGYRYKIFNYEERKPEEVRASDFFEFARYHGREYIVVDAQHTDKRVLSIIDFENLREGTNYYGYNLLEKGENYAVFEFQK